MSEMTSIQWVETTPASSARRGSLRPDVEASVLHRVVRENLATLLRECAEAGGLPRFVEKDFERYLSCGVLARGFTRVVCRLCRKERLVRR